jgi:hypothetical protein
LGRASLAMVCMIFIVHTIAAAQHGLKMCSPDAYSEQAFTAGHAATG